MPILEEILSLGALRRVVLFVCEIYVPAIGEG